MKKTHQSGYSIKQTIYKVKVNNSIKKIDNHDNEKSQNTCDSFKHCGFKF